MAVTGALREAARAVMHENAKRDFFAANYARLAGWVRRQVDDDET